MRFAAFSALGLLLLLLQTLLVLAVSGGIAVVIGGTALYRNQQRAS